MLPWLLGAVLATVGLAIPLWAEPPPGAAGWQSPCDHLGHTWSEISNKHGVRVSALTNETAHPQAYRAQGTLAAPIEQILMVLRDSVTAAEWMPDLGRQEDLERRSAFESVTRSVYPVPFPFADRELVLRNRLFLDREGGALVAHAVSVEHPLAPPMRGRVRAQMQCSRIRLTPLAADRTGIDFVMRVEPGGRVPAFMAAWQLRQAPFKFVKALENRARTAGYRLPPEYVDLLGQLRALSL